MISLVKMFVFGVSFLAVLPLTAIVWLEKKLSKSEILFAGSAQFLALIPSILGVYLRAAFYFGSLDVCSWENHIGFGSLFSHRGARIERRVSTGVYCVLGHVDIGSDVRIASHVSVPSGKRQHLDDKGNLSGVSRYDRVSIGEGSWIGEGAIVLAAVGKRSIVSAGSVVVSDQPDDVIIGGNPAKVLKEFDRYPDSDGKG